MTVINAGNVTKFYAIWPIMSSIYKLDNNYYEDNEFDESSDEEVELNVVFKGTLETENSSDMGYPSWTSL